MEIILEVIQIQLQVLNDHRWIRLSWPHQTICKKETIKKKTTLHYASGHFNNESRKDFRAHYKYAFKKILESYCFQLTGVVMFNSGDHTILTFCTVQFIVLICLSPEQKYLENVSKEYK